MQDDAGIFRDAAGLNAALEQLDEYDERVARIRAPSGNPVYNPGWHLCRDLRNMLVVSRAVARSALVREESRGAHSRLDFPEFDDYWGEHNIVIRSDGGGEMRLEAQPVVKSAELSQLVEQRREAERR
jgi:succinate dehydrogenase / fumarate reductase flavoprotein subunit